MLHIATLMLGISVLLFVGAIVLFLRSAAVARWLVISAIGAAVLGALETVFANELTGVGNWAFLFACGACGCGVTALRHVNRRLSRWIHRFVIYAGYAATFAMMSAIGLVLHAREAGGKLAALVFVPTYVAGSLCIFAAKTLIARHAEKTMPEYQSSIGRDLHEW